MKYPKAIIVLLFGLAITGSPVVPEASATDYSWNSAAASTWTTPGSWTPSGTPGALDNILTPTQFGQLNFSATAALANNFTFSGSTAWSLVSNSGTSSLTLGGDLTKNGSGMLTFRKASSTGMSLAVGGDLLLSSGTMEAGQRASGLGLNSFSVTDSISVSGNAVLTLNVLSTATVGGSLNLTGTTTKVHIANGANGTSGTLQVGSLVSSDATPVIAANDFSSNSTVTTATLSINGTGGTSAYAGKIQSTSNGSTNSVLNLDKTGGSTQILSGANTYTGTTTVGGGTLLVNGTHTGAGAYTANGGILGGGGSITTAANAGITINSGAKLSAGDSAGAADTLALNLGTGVLNLSGAVGGSNAGGLVFDLGASGSGTSDIIALNAGTLDIGTGVLEFSDFNFTALGGFGAGTYTLFDTASVITGTLGSGLSGTIGGFSGTLSFANSNNDLILTVSTIPEPSTYALLVMGFAGLWVLRRNSKRS